MGKAPASDSIMAADKMKPLLALSKREPVQAAIALTADGQGLILLDKKAKPRKVGEMLKVDAGKGGLKVNLATLRYGRAEVDPDYDPAMVRFFINKDAPGTLRPKLVEVVRLASYQKVEINVDPSIDAEEGAESEGTEEGAPSPPPPPIDLSALRTELAGLIRQIVPASGGDAERAGLMKAAEQMANEGLHANDPVAAGAGVARLRELIGGGLARATTTAPAAPQGGEGAVVRLAKGLLLWNGTRGYVQQQLKKLGEAILAQSVDEVDFDAIKANLGRLDAILEVLDDRLTDKLNELRGATDVEAKARIAEEARGVVREYQTYVAGDALMADIDRNGFIALDLKARVTAALDGVLKII